MLKQWFFRVVLMTAMAALWVGLASAGDDGVPRIGKDDVKARLGSGASAFRASTTDCSTSASAS